MEFTSRRGREYTLEDVERAVNEFCDDWGLENPGEMATHYDKVLAQRERSIDASGPFAQISFRGRRSLSANGKLW